MRDRTCQTCGRKVPGHATRCDACGAIPEIGALVPYSPQPRSHPVPSPARRPNEILQLRSLIPRHQHARNIQVCIIRFDSRAEVLVSPSPVAFVEAVKLELGASTNGADALKLAYKVAYEGEYNGDPGARRSPSGFNFGHYDAWSG